MSTVAFTIRERIQAQGFCGLEDATYTQINYPLRLSPAYLHDLGGRRNGARLTNGVVGLGAIRPARCNSAWPSV